MFRKATITLAVIAIFTLVAALPALAYGVDSGNVTCTNKIAVQSRTTYDASIWDHSVSLTTTYHDGSTPTDHTTATQVYGPNSSRVTSTDGTVYAAETYAYCWGE